MSAPAWFQTVQGNLSSGRALFTGVELENSDLFDLSLPDFSNLALEGATVTPSQQGFSAVGLTDILSLGKLPATVSLICDAEDWEGTLAIQVPFALPFLENVVEKPCLELRFGGTESILAYAAPCFSGQVDLAGPPSRTITLSPLTASGDVSLAFDGRFDLSSAGAVLEAVGAGGSLAVAPLSNVHGAVSVGNIAVALRSDNLEPDELQFDVQVESLPVPIAGVTLQEFCFGFLGMGLAAQEQRSISACVSGRIGIGGAIVDIYGRVPELIFRGSSTGPLEVDFGEMYQKLLHAKTPIEIPPLTISDLAVDLQLREPLSVRVSSRVDGQWPIPGTPATLDEIAFDLELSAANPHVTVFATTNVAGLHVQVSGTFGSELELDGTLSATSLSEMLSRFNVARPPEIPDVQLGPTTVAISGERKTLHLSASASVSHDFFASGQTPPEITVALSIDLAPKQAPAIQLAVSTTARVTIEDSVSFDGFTFAFNHAADGTWTASGSVAAQFMRTRLDLTAEYQSAKTGSHFALAVKAMKASIDIAAATLGIQSFTIDLARDASGSNPQLSVKADASLEVKDLLQLDGTLIVSGGGVSFAPKAGGGVLTLQLPAVSPQHKAPQVVLNFTDVRIGQAECTLAASIQLRDVPPPADVLFGSKPTTGTLTVDSKGIAVDIVPPAGASMSLTFARGTKWEMDLPAIRVEKLSLGRQATSPAGGAAWQLGATLGVDGLDRFNALCGGADVFRQSVDLVVALGASLAVTPTTSPFNAIELRTKEDGTVWTAFADFFGSGRLSFRVPELSFDFQGGRWRAAGGVESQGGLQIPLRPIKWLAEKCGIGSAALQPMPDAIPLVDLHLTSPSFYDEVARLLAHGDADSLKTFKTIAGGLAKGADALPDRLKEYLAVHIPTNFVFDLAIEPTGGASFGFRVEDEKPLRVLVPFVVGVPPLPGLLGVTISAVSFGLTAGGQVGVLMCDGDVDQFDALDLIYALVTGKGNGICNRIIMRKLEALIPIETPVPIPLFYDDIGWEYRNLLGLTMEFHASFPDPQPALSDWVTLLADLLHFFGQNDYLLHEPGHLPQAMQLDFRIEPTFLALPDYLGGAVLGARAALPRFPVTETLARALDGMKTGNMGYLIQAVPLKYESGGSTHWIRVGHEDVRFGPLHIQAAWCITTEEEFQNEVLRDDAARKAIASINPDTMLDCTPANLGGKSYDKGFLVLLMGEAGAGTPLTNIVSFRAQFGMALLGPRDFQTAVRLAGAFGPGNALSLTIEGNIDVRPDAVHPEAVAIVVAGSVTLTVLGQRFSAASSITVVPGELLRGHVAFRLGEALTVQGTLTIDAQGIGIDGSIDWSGIAGHHFDVASRATLSKTGLTFLPIAVTVGAFAARATLQVPGTGKGDVFTMGVAIDLPDSFFAALKASFVQVADEVVTEDVRAGYEKVRNAIEAQKSFEPSLRGLRAWVPAACAAAVKSIQAAVSEKGVYAALDAWADQVTGLERATRVVAVAAAKAGGAVRIAQQSAQPWIDKLTGIQRAAAASIEDSDEYRSNLQAALRRLATPNTITVSVGAIGPFPGVTVYRRTVLNADQLRQLNEGIAAIGFLQKACDVRISAQQVFDAMPEKQRLLAQVRQDIKDGVDASVPIVKSVSFDASAGLSSLASVDLVATVSYSDKTTTYHLRADLSNPAALAQAVARAFA